MIISHTHKFIFSKPRKVAGTSVEVALSKYCGENDVITPNVSSKEIDEGEYTDYARNYEGYFNHMRPSRIQQKMGKKIWNDYFTFSIVRNPWDMLVSRFFWNKKNATPRMKPDEVLKELSVHPFNIDLYGKLFHSMQRELLETELLPDDTFEIFLKKKLPSNYSNTKYYFDRKGKPYNDFVIRYENLQEDYKTVCERIGVPYEPLPQLKTKTRQERDYRQMYSDELHNWVVKEFEKEIEYFHYTF